MLATDLARWFRDYSGLIQAVAAVILLGVTGWYAILTKRLVTTAKQQSDAAVQSAQLAADQMESQQRAELDRKMPPFDLSVNREVLTNSEGGSLGGSLLAAGFRDSEVCLVLDFRLQNQGNVQVLVSGELQGDPAPVQHAWELHNRSVELAPKGGHGQMKLRLFGSGQQFWEWVERAGSLRIRFEVHCPSLALTDRVLWEAGISLNEQLGTDGTPMFVPENNRLPDVRNATQLRARRYPERLRAREWEPI